jgi:hypothetical protein
MVEYTYPKINLLEEEPTIQKEVEKSLVEEEKKEEVIYPDKQFIYPESITSNIRNQEPEGGTLTATDSNDEDNLQTGKTNGFARLEKLSNLAVGGYKFAEADAYYKLFATPASWFLSDETQTFAKTGLLPEDPNKAEQVKKEINGTISGHMFKVYNRLKDEEREQKIEILNEYGLPEGGVAEKLAFGVGTIPVEFAKQIPALIATKGKAAPSFAITEAFFASEDGPIAATKAAAFGYTLGKIMDVTAPLPRLQRMSVLGTVGFGLGGPSFEDRVVSASLFGGLAFFGVGRQRAMYDDIVKDPKNFKPKVMNKEVKLYTDMINNKIPDSQKNFNKQIDIQNKLVNDLKETTAKLKKDKNNKELLVKQGEQQELLNAQINITKEFDAEGFTLAKNKDLIEKFRSEVIDGRPVNIIKRDMFEITGSNDIMRPKFKDVDPFIGRGILTKQLAFKPFPILNVLNQKINLMRIKVDRDTEIRLDDPTRYGPFLQPKFTQTFKITTEQAGKVTPVKKLFFSEKEAKAYFDTKLGTNVKPFSKIEKAEQVLVIDGKIQPATKLVDVKMGQNSIFYYLEKLSTNKQIKVKDAMIKAEEVYISGKKPNLFEKNGNIKHSALKDEFKLDADEAAAFLQIRNGLDDVYDNLIKSRVKFSKEKVEVVKQPNFFPHRFNDRYLIRVGEGGKKDKLIYVDYAPSKKKANEIVNKILKEDPNLTANARLNENYVKEGSKFYKVDDDINLLSHSQTNYKSLKDLPENVRKILFETKRTGLVGEIGALGKKRREGNFVKGFKGTAPGKKGLKDFKFVIESYVRGAVKKTHMLELDNFFNKFFYEPITDAKMYNRYLSRDGHLVKDTFSIANSYPKQTAVAQKLLEDALGRTPASAVSSFIKEVTKPLSKKSGILLRDIDNFFGGLNAYTAFRSLFFWNGRFLAAQGIQPSQIIVAKLHTLADKSGGVVSPHRAWADSFKDMMFVTPKTMEFVDALMRFGTVNKKFMNEFFGEAIFRKGKVRKQFKDALQKGDYTGVAKKIAYNLSGLNVTGRVEQYSRLQAALMFRNLYKQMGIKDSPAMYRNASNMADMYMVRYDLIDRPSLFTERGLGILAKPFGLFKTWQQNWYAQFGEHLSNAVRRKEYKGFGAFFLASTLVAGVTQTIGIRSADSAIQLYNNIFDDNVRTLSQRLYELGLPSEMLFGLPSATGLDLQSTLGVPNFDPRSVLSIPGYDIIVQDLLFDVLPVIIRDAKASLFDTPQHTTEQRRDAYKVLLPTPFHAAFELAFQKEGDTTYFDKKGKAIIDRDFDDWFARFLSSYSVEEAYFGKLQFQYNILSKSTQYSYSFLAKSAADKYFHTGEIPEFMFIMALDDFGKLPEEFIKSIKTHMKKRFDDSAEVLSTKGTDYDVLREYVDQRIMKFETKDSIPPLNIFKGDENLFF